MSAESVQPAPALAKGAYAVPLRRGPRLKLAAHPDAPNREDPAAVRTWVRSLITPTAIDLFCGAGGLSLGLEDAGFTVVLGADSDPYALETHGHNVRGLTYKGDLSDPTDLIETLDRWGMAKVDLIAGGVPCQPFSQAGRSKIRSLVKTGDRSPVDPRASLWMSFLAVVKHVKPRAVLVENVPGLAIWDEGAVLIGLCEGLQDLGYWVDPRVVNAHDHQVPQHRSRLFIVGFRDRTHFSWPPASHKQKPSVRRAIGDLPRIPPGHREEEIRYVAPEDPSDLLLRLRRLVSPDDSRRVWDHISREVRPDDAEAFSSLRPGGTYLDLPKSLRRYRDDIFSDKYKRLEWDGLSRTITAHIAKDGYWYIHPGQDRTLSIREAARLQTFPDWFRFAGNPSHRQAQIGNAVPPLLAEAIGRRINEELKRRGRPPRGRTSTGFRSQLLEWYRTNGRDFPWRESGLSPWLVLMAEVCLHRTRAEQVRPVFEGLARIAPTPRDMIANAERAIDAMESLGLRWRAKNLVDVAKAIIENHEGRVPSTREALRGLPGVGDYIANAVVSFGFRRKAVILDTNTMRVVRRVTGKPSSSTAQVRIDLYRLAGREGADAEFNLALLDLGGIVCTARRPKCESCPIAALCASRQFSGTAGALPASPPDLPTPA